ncbi:hypothetical protein NMY22_g4747 [Coprinellus aureogranulatus]|nr:hypothetical protein NMY22_g4747 [Coprinellus aureogranulatus]
MDIIIIAAGLTILLARDVFRTVRRKTARKENQETPHRRSVSTQGSTTPAEYAYLTSSSRQYYDYRDHMHRFHHPPPGIPIPAPRTSPNHPDRGVVPRRYGEFGRSRTVDGSEYVERLGTPPPPYTPPPRISSEFTRSDGSGGAGSVVGVPESGTVSSEGGHMGPNSGTSSAGAGASTHAGPPPPFEHAYTTDASGMSAEAQRKEQGLETVIEHGWYCQDKAHLEFADSPPTIQSTTRCILDALRFKRSSCKVIISIPFLQTSYSSYNTYRCRSPIAYHN